MRQRLLVLVCGLVVFELLARARMSERPCCSVVEVVQRPSTSGEAGQRALSKMHVEKSHHHAIRGHSRCSVQMTSFRSVYKENISELRQMGHVSSKRCHAQIKRFMAPYKSDVRIVRFLP